MVKAKKAVSRTWRNGLIIIVVVLVVVAAVAAWHFYFRPSPIEPASVEKMAFPLPDKPSIAVLAFTNMSEDPKYLPVRVYLAASYINQGQQKEALIEASVFSTLSLQASMEEWKQRLPYKNQAVIKHLFESLRNAGLK